MIELRQHQPPGTSCSPMSRCRRQPTRSIHVWGGATDGGPSAGGVRRPLTQPSNQRPHEALGLKPPASRWHPSPRGYPDPLPSPDYPERFEVRWVSDAGSFCWKRPMFIGMALAGKRIGLEEIDDGIWSVYFHRVLLGRFDERKLKLYP